jgi:transcriptional regulator with PAS, ATPase and Fis domain
LPGRPALFDVRNDRYAFFSRSGNVGTGLTGQQLIDDNGEKANGDRHSDKHRVASTAATVLLTGESGTGKELLAREIHERSRRSQLPFVRVNCSAIPREMFESEFLGHVRGAFTGAMRDRPGRFQIANGGTIFLRRNRRSSA